MDHSNNSSWCWSDLPDGPPPDQRQDAASDFACRAGIAKIVTNSGSGTYTVTEQRRDNDPYDPAWCNAPGQIGCVNVTAMDYLGRDGAQAGRIVRFWQQRSLGGKIDVFIDIGEQSEKVKVSADDTTADVLGVKLVGDDGAGDNVKVTLVEQNGGGNETLKIVIDKDDLPNPGGMEGAICHRIKIPDGSSGGTYEFSSDDWRGRMLLCSLMVVYSASPSTVQWGGGATSSVVRMFGESWANTSDRTLVSASGGDPEVRIDSGTGKLYWSWAANNIGNDLYAICLIRATITKTSNDYTVS